MKNILSKIEFHYTYLIIAFGFIITGYFSNLIIFSSLVLVHELGHVCMFLFYKIKINKVIIYPFGGVTKISSIIDIDIDTELIIAIMGVVFQSLFFVFLNCLDLGSDLVSMYHFSILVFNLLPIYPLDGFKIFNLYLSKFFSYKLSNIISLIISVIFIFILIIVGFNNYSYYLIISVLFYNIYIYYKNIDVLYNRFVLERYLYKYNFNKYKIIDNIKNMYRNRKHLFISKNGLVKEDKYLSKVFK